MKIISTFLVLFFLASPLTYSQSNKARKISEVKEDGTSVVMNTYTPQVPFITNLVDPEGTVTNLKTFADYVTNGNTLKKVEVLGDTVVVTGDYLDSAAALNTRRIRYNVSYDGGLTWGADVLVVSNTDNQAYGNITPVISTNGRTVAISGRQYAPGSRGFSGEDLLIGLGVFATELNPVPGRDFVSEKMSNTTLGGTYLSTDDSVFFIKFDITSNTFSGKELLASPPTEVSTLNTRQTSTVSSNGQNIFAMWWNGNAGFESLAGKESTNGGTTFGTSFTILPTNYIAEGDTIFPWFGMDAIYKPGTNTKCAAFSTNAISDYGARRQYKVLYWSPGVNSGNAVVVADWQDTAIHILNDSLTFLNFARTVQVGMTYVSHPTIAFSDDGSRLICVYTASQPDTTSYSFNYNDIFVSYSDDNGATWSNARNITNTPNLDEIYPSISKTGNLPGNFGVVYQVSECPGSSSFNQTSTPKCPVYWVYRRYDPVSGNQLPIGVKKISNEIPNAYGLHQNFPNPFNPTTKIRFEMPKNDLVTLKVYDIIGREVRTLVKNEQVAAGVNEVVFDASNLSSGIYFYSLETGDFRATKKMILIK